MRPEHYASALLRLHEKGVSARESAEQLIEVLKKSGRMALLPRIGKAFARLAGKMMRNKRQTLIIAHEKEKSHARKESEAKHAEVRIDANLISGWRLESGDELRDVSGKKHLLTMYDKVISQ